MSQDMYGRENINVTNVTEIQSGLATSSALTSELASTVAAIGALLGATASAEANVVSAAADTALLPANAARKGFAVRNDSTTTLYIAKGGAASAASFIIVPPGGLYESTYPCWLGTVRGFGAGAPVGNWVVREET